MEIRDLGALEQACKALGLELIRGQKTYRWWGSSVGDYPLPTGYAREELGHCEHAIRIPGDSKAYEIGVVSRRDGRPGYELLWDFYNGGFGMEARVGQGAVKLKREYAAAFASRQLYAKGYRVARHETTDGRIVLEASR